MYLKFETISLRENYMVSTQQFDLNPQRQYDWTQIQAEWDDFDSDDLASMDSGDRK